MSRRVWLRRAYDPPSVMDGHRVLVDRLWPRGVRKDELHIDTWARHLAPSDDLRHWFGHDPDRWEEFRTRYRSELAALTDRGADELAALIDAAGTGRVTLVFAARDTERNNAVVLRELIESERKVMSINQPPEFIIYGDFNCPFCSLASARARHLERRGLATIDWRAVEHAPDIDEHAVALEGRQREQLSHELDQVRGLLFDGEPDRFVLPSVHSNTHRAITAYAATPEDDRPRVRQNLFDAYWVDREDLSDPTTLTRLGATAGDDDTVARWRAEWLALPGPIVPVMVLPDGHSSRGLGALTRLADLITKSRSTVDRSDLGGEIPCSAHLW